MGLEGRNSCHNNVAEQCEKGRSDTFEGNQFGSEEGGRMLCAQCRHFGNTSRESASIQP